MNRKKIYALIGIVCIVVLASFLSVYFAGQRTRNSWLSTDDYMVYKQDFSWASGNATEYMFWNVTSLNGALANIHLVSHGVDFSNGSVIFPESDIALTLNITNREVISLSNRNSEMQVGSKWPFWIPASFKDGDPVETMYGSGYISPGQTVDIMGVNRNCWLLSYTYSAGNNMDRFYDKATGICLDIQTHLFSDGISVNVTETAIQTNLKLT